MGIKTKIREWLLNRMDFSEVADWVETKLSYTDTEDKVPIRIGKAYYIGSNGADSIEYGLCYDKPFKTLAYVLEQCKKDELFHSITIVPDSPTEPLKYFYPVSGS